jgi:putative endonuclease
VRSDSDRVRRGGLLPDPVLSQESRPGDARKRDGDRAEEAVADFLVARGFRILARNLRLGHLELDVVAQRGGLVVIVEVRTRGRGSFESALASISGAKRRHLLLATDRLWRGRLARDAEVERLRIDVAAVSFDEGETRVEYIAGAVTASP